MARRIHATAPGVTQAERQALHALRRRYQETSDRFSERELAHLRFLRWLSDTGHFRPS